MVAISVDLAKGNITGAAAFSSPLQLFCWTIELMKMVGSSDPAENK